MDTLLSAEATGEDLVITW